ncbi:Ig-like domain repeat protein, partial [Methanobrevibacter sp.]
NTMTGSKSGGGSLYIASAVDITLTDVSFENSKLTSSESSGGAFNLGTSTNVVIDNVNFTNCHADASSSIGGAIYNSGSSTTFILNNTRFINVSSSYRGGAIFKSNSGKFDILNSVFNNTDSQNGGSVYVETLNNNFCVDNVNISNAAATQKGGVICVNTGGSYDVSISNVNIEEFDAKTSGAVFYVVKTKDFILNNVSLKNSHTVVCSDNGGLIYLGSATGNVNVFNVNLTNSTVTSSSKLGGAMYIGAVSKNVELNKVIFANNTMTGSKSGGGSLYIASAVDITLTDVSFENSKLTSSESSGGAAYLGSATNILFTNVEFNNNILSAQKGKGGSLYMYGATGITFTNVSFNNSILNAYESYGGALYLSSSSNVNMNHVNFTNCHVDASSSNGGAIYVTGSSTSFTLENASFINISASQYGGIIFNDYSGKFNIYNSTFDSSKAQVGGAIYINKAINGVKVYNSNFTNTNATNGDAGSIFFNYVNGRGSQNVEIVNSNFKNYKSTGKAGSIYFYHVSTNSKIQNCTFIDGQANIGGALYTTENSIQVIDSKFINNTAETQGGAIYWNGASGKILNSEFKYNVALSDSANGGGAIYAPSSANQLSIENSNFTGNNASYGGAIHIIANSINIVKSTFTDNYALYSGGAIYLKTKSSSIKESWFKNNTAEDNNPEFGHGGAVYILSGSSLGSNKISDSTFIENHANDGAGVYLKDINNDGVNNCSFISNHATQDGGGLYLRFSDAASQHYVDWNNFKYNAHDVGDNRITWSTYVVSSLFENNTDYIINIVPKASGTSSGVIDVYVPIISNNHDHVPSTDAKMEINVINATGDVKYTNLDVEVDAGFASETTNYLSLGDYNVTVKFSDKYHLEKTNMTTFIIELGIGEFEYLQKLINDAIAAGNDTLILDRNFKFSIDGDMLIDYSQINITSNNPFTIKGTRLIEIDAQNKCRIFLANSSFITIENIRFVNGNASGECGDGNLNGGAIFWKGNNGTIINSEFRDNSAEYGGGIYYNSSASDCKIINCQFIENNATFNGGAIDCNASGMNLTNTVFESNKGEYGAALCREINATGGFGYNNTFKSNHAYKSGAALGWINATSIKIDTYYFYNNTADVSGGAIYVGEGSGQCHILNSYFEGNNVTNKTSGTGGAIYWFAEEGLVFNTIFVNNNAFEGGAIYIGNSSDNINLTKSKFTANNAIGDGGAIYLGASTATLNYTEFYDNTALNGGAIYVGSNGTTNYIYNSIFNGNNATNGNGGAVDWVASAGHIIESNFTNNRANYGGAVYMGGDSKNSAISKVIFDGNVAIYNGGAIDWNSTGGNLTHTIFKNNVADYGAALCRESGATGGFGYNNTFRSNHARISGAALGWMGSVGININTYYFYDNTAGVSGAAIYVSPESHRCIINNSDFRGNHILDETTGIGGAIDCEAENATIINSNFTENRAANGGAIWVGSESGITNIAGSIFKSNTAYGDGGAINLNSSAVNVFNSKFYNNRGTNGAGMYVGGENLTNYIDSSLFEGNNASGGLGGAVDWVASSGQIIRSTFNNNYADYGGGVYMGGDSKNSRISYVIFDGNIAKYNGGAIDWNSTGGNLTHTEFKNNVADYGAALCREAGATAGYGYNNTFRSNHARISGAALGWMGSVGININTYYFYDNTAGVSGAAIYVGNGSDNCVINNSLFKGNHILNETGGRGGAIDIVADNATIVNSNFTENNAYDGGAIYVGSQSGQTIISNATFTKNTAVNNGGAINLEASGVTLNATKFTSNSALNGGAIYVEGTGVTNHIYSSTFDKNTANGGRGGAIDWVASTGNIYNSNFTENSADYGGGVYIGGNSSGSRITNVLFTSNSAKYNGGAIDWNATGGNLTNTKFVSNYAEYGAALCREANSTGGFGYNNTFIGNHAYKSGAALGWLGANGITINYYTFINNTADESGGSIYVGPGSDNCKVYNSKFENSASSKGRGGDIDWIASNGTVINSTFKNSNGLYGGSIYVGENSNSTEIINSNFTQTRSLGSGGALDWHGDDGRIINCNFLSSFAFEKGGVISASNVNNMLIDNSTFGYNMASGYPDGQGNAQGNGAAIYCENGNNINISNSRFNNNEGHNRGGTLAIVNTNNSNINNISIKSSRAVKDGGAISWINSSNITLQKVSIDDSSANYNGGSIYFDNVDDVKFKDSKINDTSTPWGNGGALYVNGNVTIDNVTFTNYRASEDNAAAIFFNDGNSTVVNSKFVSPNSIWVYHNATVYLTKNNITGNNPNKHIEYLTQEYNSKYNPVDYSVWNDGTVYLEGNNFDYVIFNNGTIKTHVDIYILDNTTWNATLNENFTFFASIKDDMNNSIISVKSLDSYNNHVEVDKTFFMPYNRIVLPVTYQGVFVIFGKDKGLENYTLHTGIVQVKTVSQLELNHTHVNDEVVIVTAKVTPKGNYSFTGTVTFRMGKNVFVADISPEGIATWTLNNLSSGTYTVTAVYSGDNNHTIAENSTLIDVELRKTWIKIVVENIIYGQYALVNVTTNANGTVLFSIHGRNQRINITDGKILEYFDFLIEPGTHTIGVVYLGNEYYEYQLNSTNFTVFKQNTTIDVVPINSTYGENELINVTLNENATGYVKITIGNNVYLEAISEGVAKFNITGLAAGNYTNILAEFIGSEFVNGNSTNFSFVVKPTNKYNITVNAEDIKYGENATVVVYLPGDATGNVTIYIDDLPAFTNVNVTNGVATLYNVTGLDAGNHTVNVTYNGDISYIAKDKNGTIFHVTPTDEWEINIDIEEHKYGENTIINITVPEDVLNKNITVNIDGNNYTVNLTEGKGSLVLNNLSAGMHKLTANYTGDGRYGEKAASTKFFIEKSTPTIIISVDPIKVGENATITVTIPENVTGNVTIFVGDKSVNRSAEGHTIVLNVSGLAYGNHTIVVNYEGDVNYTKSTNTTNLTVEKWNSEVKVTSEKSTYYVGDQLVITVTNSTTVTNLTINGHEYGILPNGKVNITEVLPAGHYIVTATIKENNKYYANTSSVSFDIIKYNSNVTVELIPENDKYYVGDSFIINVTNNTVAKVTINGKEYGILSNGNVNITTKDLPAGTYNVVVTIPENNKFKGNSTNVSFVIVKRSSSVNITVDPVHMYGDVFDIIVENDTFVNVTINGKQYNVTSDKKVDINTSTLPTGHYVVIATIYENGKYLGSMDTKEFDVIKLNSTVNVTVSPN